MTIARLFSVLCPVYRAYPRSLRSFLVAGMITCVAGLAQDEGNGQALSPPLGWSSWSALETNIDENTIQSIAQIQASLLKPAGYIYVNVDGGWYMNPDLGVDSNGRWMAAPSK